MEGKAGTHVLVFPYPAQGHMLPLLDFTHHLVIRGLTITILITPENLPLLNPLLSKHPSVMTLVLPFPKNHASSIPAGVENTKEIPPKGFFMMQALVDLYDPLLQWFRSHHSPPVAIISDIFLGWTHHLACELGIRRIMFSPSGVLATSLLFAMWRYQPTRNDPNDKNQTISFPKIPNCPAIPWWQLSPLYRRYVEGKGDAASEVVKDGFLANLLSWGFVFNSFTELERVYSEYMPKELGHDRVWTTAPLLALDDGPNERGGPSSVSVTKILSFLDTCDDRTAVYVCFGSQVVLTNEQMKGLTLALEESGVRFILTVKSATEGHVDGDYGAILSGLEDRVAERGMVIRGWAPQVTILRHPAVGAFLTHCGWNSLMEGLVAGVPMMTWPMGADQFTNTILLVDQLKVATRVCEGREAVPDSKELARTIREAVNEFGGERTRAMELRKAALAAIKEGGSSHKNLDELVGLLSSSS